MQLFDHTSEAPAENLALDEVLIVGAEAGKFGEVLRLWESPVYFVVLGAGGAVDKEADTAACDAAGVPILRRCSGGGTVVQGPGCLNYTLLLDRDARPEMGTIEHTNTHVLARVAHALEHCGVPVKVDGISDLTVDGLKFSGNAQRRRKRWILFHGTVLHSFDLALIAKYLREPEKQPDYRHHRSHRDFVTNVVLDPVQFKRELAKYWGAEGDLTAWPEAEMQKLVDEKYRTEKWNRAF